MAPRLSPLLDMNSMLPAFEDQYELTRKRQETEAAKTIRDLAIDDEAARKGKTVSDQAIQAAQANRDQQLSILSGVSGTVDKAKRAIELSDSDNPLDRVTLYMMQQADPEYTRDGNLRRLEYYNSAASSIAGVGLVEQAGYADQLNQISSDTEFMKREGSSELALLKMREAQGQEVIEQASSLLATQAGMIQNRISIQQNALTQVPDEAIDAAILEAQKTDTKSANVGGVDVPLSFLESRKVEIENRKYNKELQNSNMVTLTLNNMTAEDVAVAESDASGAGNGYFIAENGTNIPLARLRERRAALMQQDFSLASQAEGLRGIEQTKKRTLDKRALTQGYNVTELTKMLATDGKDSDGYQYDLDLIQETLAFKKGAQSEMTQTELLEATGALSERPAVDANNYLNSVKATPGTALSQLIERQKQNTAYAASRLADPATDEAVKVDMLTLLDAQRAQLDESIKQQALTDASGDKDLALIHEAKIRGTTVAPDVMDNMIIERAKKGLSLAGILPQNLNAEYLRTYQAALADMSNLDNAMIYGGMSATDKKEAAANTALLRIKSQASAPLTEEVLAFQTFLPGNPLHGKVSGQKFLTLVHQAETAATQDYMRSTGMKQEDIDARIQGAVVDEAFNNAQNARVLMELDKIQPGLGKAYVDWWTSPESQKAVENFKNQKAGSAQTPQDLAGYSLVAPDLVPSFTIYGQNTQMGYESLFANQLAAEHTKYVTFGGDARLAQAFLLEQTPELSNEDKKVGLTLITPILEEAKAQNLNYEQTQKFIEGRIRTLQVPGGDPTRVLKKMIQGRSAALKVVDDFIGMSSGFAMVGGPMLSPRSVQVGETANDRVNNAVGGLKWLQEMNK